MRIKKSGSVVHADNILREIKRLWPKAWEGHLEHLANGREQGYHLIAYKWSKNRKEYCQAACSFSEARSSDSALVLVGRAYRDFNNGMLSEELWDSENHRGYFNDYVGGNNHGKGSGDRAAAKWAIKRLREIMAEDLKEKRERRAAKEA